jgi:hypothetical protein
MPLQNRVTPYGALVAVAQRGLLMGNRGILHDAGRRIVRDAQGRRWIACALAFRGRRRAVMRPGSYTELFFLDETVALAAGHRPCAECRRADYQRFRAAWAHAFGGALPPADTVDRVLHRDRLDGAARRTWLATAAELPDGTYVDAGGRAWLLLGDRMLAWSAGGYVDPRARPRGDVTVITPRCTVRVLAAGYRPLVHPGAVAVG